MFNWVCPNCGKDVPPSKTDCPYCPGLPAAAVPPPPYGYPAPVPPPPSQSWAPQPPSQSWAPQPPSPQQGPQHASPQPWQPSVPVAPQGWQPPPPPAPVYQAPPAPPPQQMQPPPSWPLQHHYAPAPPPPVWAAPPEKTGLPAWLLGVGFAVLLLAAGAALYFVFLRPAPRTNAQEKAGLENPANPSQQKVSNPLQKYVEVVGIRLVSQDKKPTARFVVVNHSNADINGLAANVMLWASTSRSEEDSIGSFSFELRNLGPNGSQEVTAPLKTKLKPYEMPDWQNATAEIQITSPQP